MRKNVLLLLAMTAISIVGLSGAISDSNDEGYQTAISAPVLKTMQAENASLSSDVEKQLLLQGWNQYVQDINYSSYILNSYVNNNFTGRQALTLTTSVFILNSKSLSDIERIEPQKEYADFYNYTLNGMKYFNSYLWNLGKYYETTDVAYIIKARSEFNQSQEYYKKARVEVDFIF